VRYVKNIARGIALLQTAKQLNHRTYNVAAGRASSNREIVAAIREVLPGARIELVPGRDPHSPSHDSYPDISRIRQDTGYQPPVRPYPRRRRLRRLAARRPPVLAAPRHSVPRASGPAHARGPSHSCLTRRSSRIGVPWKSDSRADPSGW
jgi:hypothetical protein